jgi:hypothetical protein
MNGCDRAGMVASCMNVTTRNGIYAHYIYLTLSFFALTHLYLQFLFYPPGVVSSSTNGSLKSHVRSSGQAREFYSQNSMSTSTDRLINKP